MAFAHGSSTQILSRPLPLAGNRPVQLKKSTWDDRQVTDKRTGKPIKRMVEEKERKPDKKARQETFQPRQFYQGRH